jgi:type IV secretion system protein VirD4
LYIVTKPNDKARLKPLVRIVVNMIVRLLADKLDFENGRPKPSYKHRLLAMIDEFPPLGRLEILQESLTRLSQFLTRNSRK